LACVLAPSLTRENIFEAIRRRRVFGTSGNRPLLDFRVNGHLMGEEIEVEADEPIRISAYVAAREPLKWLTIVRNNENWHYFGGEGWHSRFSVVDKDPPKGESYYYLRVE